MGADGLLDKKTVYISFISVNSSYSSLLFSCKLRRLEGPHHYMSLTAESGIFDTRC